MAGLAKRILIVEDERAIARALELKLTHAGFLVTVASNGQEAFRHLEKHEVDLIFSDIIMPVMDGFEVLEGLKKMKMKKKIPIIVLTNLSQSEDVDRAKKLGAQVVFVKSDTPLAEIVTYTQKLFSRK